MSPRRALIAAVDAPEGRARRHRLAQDFAGWWRGPDGAGPVRQALDALGVVPPEVALAAVRPWLEDLDWVARAFARVAAAMRADPLFEPPFRALSHETQVGVRLLDHALLSISLVRLPFDRVGARKRAALGPRSIAFPGRLSLTRVVEAGGGALDLWTTDAARPCLSAADAGRCRPAGRVALTRGMVLPIDGVTTAWTLARAEGDVVLIQAFARTAATPLMLEYAAEDGRFVGATMTGGAEARMHLFATVLRTMDRADAAPVLAAAVHDAPFHLRWQLTRELLALDAAAARPLLDTLARADPHPEVRRAAAETLHKLAA